MKRYLVLLLLSACLVGCAERGCHSFASREVALCIPGERVLGSLWFLGKTSDNEIGLQIGESEKANLITVTLTRRDYFCKHNGQSRFCRPETGIQEGVQEVDDVVRVYLDEQEKFWDYRVAGAKSRQSIANCSSIPDQPHVGRCISAGTYKDIIYSAIFLDTRVGGVLQVQNDVKQQIGRWEVQVK